MHALDVTDVDFFTDPLPGPRLHELLARARDAAPVTPISIFGTSGFLVTRFDDLRAFFVAADEFPPGAMYQFHTEPVVGRTFISMDGAEHDQYRQLATPAFRSRATQRFVDDELTPLAHEVLDRFASRGSGDLVAELTTVLPFWAISRKLGLPVGSEERQRRWALGLLSYPIDPEGALRAAADMTEFLEPIVAERRADPGADVLSQLLTAEHDGVKLTNDEVFSHVRLLYSVGATTTSDAMGSMLWHLLTQPGLYERARREPDVRPRLVDELLRYEPPVALLPRMAPLGGEIAGVAIPEGSFLLAGIAAANRDPRAFAEPDRFDLDRSETDVLTFGFGNKFCPGSHLARRQLIAALEIVLDRLPELRLVEGTEPAGAILRRVERLEAEWETP